MRGLDPDDPKAPEIGMRTRRKMGFGILASLIIFAICVLAGLLWFINRPVPITVDGETSEVRVGSTLEDVLHENHVSVIAGNYIAVDESILEIGTGYAFSATVNGVRLTPEEVADYRIQGSEAIDFSDGDNIMEPYQATQESLMPTLKMEGTGYAVQYIAQWGRPGTLEHRTGNYSGITVDVMVKATEDCIIACRDLYIEGNPCVALTFDDGPLSPFTEQYLEILARYGIKATFFNLGDSIEANPALAQRIVAEGHQIANHTMAHNQLTAVDDATVYSEISRSAQVITSATGVTTHHLRPPYGDFTERSWLASAGSVTAVIRWTGDSKDWELPGAAAIVDNALLNVYSGSIILMHDGGGDRSQDVEALPQIIERLQGAGYEFLTVSDLMRRAGDIPEDICSGTASMPSDAVWPREIHPDDLAAGVQ